MTTIQNRQPLPADVRAALERVFDHLWDDERNDYERRSTDDQRGHVFEALCVIQDWICGDDKAGSLITPTLLPSRTLSAAEEATSKEAKFRLGQTVITPSALEKLDAADIQASLRRHAVGDWGNCGPADWKENEFSLCRHLRLLSVYEDRHGTKFWIVTEADRSATTVLLPADY